MKFLDVSYGVDSITPDWIARRRAEGYDGLICNLWTGSHGFPKAEQVLKDWRDSGGIIAGYMVVHDFRPPGQHLMGAGDSAGQSWQDLDFVAIDIEQVSQSDPLDQQASVHMIEAVRAGLVSAGVRKVVLYTSRYYWTAMLANTDIFADMPLWDSAGTRTPNLTVEPNYGGWKARTGHQFWVDTVVDGIQVDLNVFDPAFFAKIPSENSMQNIIESLNVAWDRAGRIQKAIRGETTESIESLAEEIKQQAIVPIKVAIGLQED